MQIKAKITTTLANLGFMLYLPNRKRARTRTFIDLKICVHPKKLFPLYFATWTSTSAKNMIWSYNYDYNVITKNTGRKAVLENLIYILIRSYTYEKDAPKPCQLYLHFPKKFAWVWQTCFCFKYFLFVKNEAAQILHINELFE